MSDPRVHVQGSDSLSRHRTFVETDANGNPWAKCSCGWAQRHRFLLAARREAKAHRRYPDGNPRLKAVEEPNA